jgi:hypothetical protein
MSMAVFRRTLSFCGIGCGGGGGGWTFFSLSLANALGSPQARASVKRAVRKWRVKRNKVGAFTATPAS